MNESELGDKAAAITDYSAEIRLDPELAFAYFNRASAADLGALDQAMADYGEVIRIDPAFADAYFNRGLL